MAAWYESWFNSPDYLKVYSHRDDSEALKLCAFLFRELQMAPGTTVLDLCCGSGRHSLAFAQLGCRVTGVDLSEHLLQIARASSVNQNNVSFIRNDVREFNSSDTFTIAVNLFTSFGYSEDDEDNFALFSTAARQIADNGSFVFDYININYLLKNLIPFSREVRDDLVIEQFRWIEKQTVCKKIVLQESDRLKLYHEAVRLYTPDEIEKALRNAGFTRFRYLGDYEGSSFDVRTSPRLLLLCQK